MVTLPKLDITVGDRLLPAPALAAIRDIHVHEVLGLPAQCEITLVNSLLVPDPADGWSIGVGLQIAVAGASTVLFTGDVTALSHSFGAAGATTIHVRAYDRLHRLRKRQTLTARAELTVADLARELAGDLGLTVEAEAEGPHWPLLLHHWPSDFDLLADVCWRAGLYLVVRRATLRLTSLDGVGEPLSLALGANLLEAEIEQNIAAVCDSVEALGWSALTAASVNGSAAGVPVDDPLGIIDATVAAVAASSGASGMPLNTPPPLAAQAASGSSERRMLGQVFWSDDHATSMAAAELARRNASASVLVGCADGDAALHPGTAVQVVGVGAPLAGRFVLTSVTHTMDQHRGYLTNFSSAPPDRPVPAASGTHTAVGIVSSVDDPNGAGRVQVTLPAYGEVATGWMGVLAPGAGAGKGIIALPDVGDRVLVLMASGDPGQGIVLGGLYGTAGAPEAGGVVNGAVRRYTVLTPGGHRLQFDDDGHFVRLEAENGSLVELGPDQLRVSATTDLTIEAPGHAIVVRAKTVDFQYVEEQE